MNYANTVAQNDMTFSYHPMPFSMMLKVNRHLIKNQISTFIASKRPQQTCFIRVTNPNMLAWGIEMGDMLVVEKNDSLFIGDLVVLEKQDEFHIYEFAGEAVMNLYSWHQILKWKILKQHNGQTFHQLAR